MVMASLAEHRLQGTVGSAVVALGLWSTVSVAVVYLLSCSTACGIFLDQGSNLCLLHWKADSLPLIHQGSPIISSLLAGVFYKEMLLVNNLPLRYNLQIKLDECLFQKGHLNSGDTFEGPLVFNALVQCSAPDILQSCLVTPPSPIPSIL